ncbi:MAG: polymer-forming cytoskeletal protein [Deltaproteobacteria bacterium]|nr:polymer-forming cytoskeletal protein [Deltaproteobacteria bacterium]
MSFKVGGEFESSWSNLLSHSGSLSSAELMEALKGWQLEGLEEMGQELGAAIEASLSNLDVVIASAIGAARAAAADVDAAEVALAIEEARRAQELVIDLNRLTGDQSVLQRVDELRDSHGNDLGNLGIQVENGRVHMGDLTIRRGQVVNGNLAVLSGDVAVHGTVKGNLAALNGDVILHSSARVEGDVVSLNGRVTRAGGYVGGQVRSVSSLKVTPRRARAAPPAPPAPTRIQLNQVSGFEAIGQGIATLLGFFVALACIGFGMNFFMPRQLEIVSETVSDSFGKSFMAGLFAQPLLLPLWAMLVVGLAITIVGLPAAVFVALALPLAVVGAAVTGYLAAAKSVGNSYLTRKMAQGHGVVVTPYRSTIYGLVGLLAIWAPAVALSWIPLIGQLLLTLAFAATWVMATAGVGAAILSRAGLRATFAGSRKQPALTDEHYWPMDASNFTPARRGRPRK